jgi:hypothetical protein
VEVFVEAGGNGNIFMAIYGPLSETELLDESFEEPVHYEEIDENIEKDYEDMAYQVLFEAKSDGMYAFCLDNRKTRFVPKAVQIDVQIPPRPEPVLIKKLAKATQGNNEESEVEDEELLERVKESIARIRKELTKIQLLQQRERKRLTFHTNYNKETHNGVMMTSIVETACFIGASLFQIFFVRRWFATRNRIRPGAKQWA